MPEGVSRAAEGMGVGYIHGIEYLVDGYADEDFAACGDDGLLVCKEAHEGALEREEEEANE